MKHSYETNTLTVYPGCRIDTSNSNQAEKEIFALIDQYQPDQLVIDAQELQYISSSGLRVILKLIQRYRDLKTVNVSSDVYEILEMTGFSEMMTVEKAYRKLDISGCKIIGKGANGTVYRYNRETIVKVYKSDADLDEIKRERNLSRAAFVLGIPTAIPYDVVKVGDCYGSVFELLDAKSFDELMIEDLSNLEFVVKESVKIDWVSILKGYLDEAEYSKLKRLIGELPDRDTIIHGDLHLKNMMLQKDETLLIDLDTMSAGHPLYELAFIFNTYKGFGVLDSNDTVRFLGIPADTSYRIWTRSLEVYFDTDDPVRLKEIEDKAAIIGYMRLMRRIIEKNRYDTERGKAFVEACHQKLRELLPKYDTLEI